MDLTEELVALVERLEPDPGPEPGTSEHTPEDFDRMAAEVLAERPPGPLWLFAYGSLIWNPDFVAEESLRGTARGWHRNFCLRLTRWRGTRETPALMLALDRGGSCAGMLYRLPDADPHGQMVRLLERELDDKPATNVPRWITVVSAQGTHRALAFIADRAGRAYAGGHTLPEAAKIIATAAGHWGSAPTYVHRTVSRLEENGIHDKNLWELQKLVAAEIREKHQLG
jgi:cation transport protein ChaC